MLKRFFRVISVLLIFSMLIPTVFANEYTVNETMYGEKSDTEIAIENLLDERAGILNMLFLEETADTSEEILSELNDKDLALARLGVTFLSDSQVRQMFPETKNDKALALTGQTLLVTGDNSVQPMVDAPDSSKNTWTTYRSSFVSNGVTYNLQRLTAQPNSSSSPLMNVGSRKITFSNNWKAGAVNVISSVGKSILGDVLSDITGAQIALSFYDAVRSFVTGIDSTTEVDVPHISYTWSNVTTAAFTYVRLSTQSDDYQWLSLVSTYTQTQVNYDIPSFTNVNGTTISPTIIEGSRTIKAIPTNYNSSELAVTAYKTVSGGPLQNCVSYIQISGPESKSVQKIYPCYPSYPLQCEY